MGSLIELKMFISKEQSQTFVVLPQGQYDELLSKVDLVFNFLLGDKKESRGEWVSSAEGRRMVGVSQKTWQNWRDRRVIPFSQFQRKIWYRRSDIEAFLQSRAIEKKGGNEDE